LSDPKASIESVENWAGDNPEETLKSNFPIQPDACPFKEMDVLPGIYPSFQGIDLYPRANPSGLLPVKRYVPGDIEEELDSLRPFQTHPAHFLDRALSCPFVHSRTPSLWSLL
jgi:hypothetical protein